MAKATVLITISGVDYSSSLKARTLRIFRKDDTKNQVQLTLTTNSDIKAGQEIIIKIDGTTYFGGLIQKAPMELITPDTTVVRIAASSYEQVCSRRTITGSFQSTNAGAIVEGILDDWLSDPSVYSEGFTLGQINAGATIEDMTIDAKNVSQIFQELAEASGYKWWITDTKELYFMQNISYSNAPYEIDQDVTNSNRLTDLRNPTVDQNLDTFRTRQFVVGKKVAGIAKIGYAVDLAEETRMSALYGSGVYGRTVINRNITDFTDASTAALNILLSYRHEPGEFSFKTAISGFNVAQKLEITFPLLKIDTTETYYIDYMTIIDYGPDILFEIHSYKKNFVTEAPRQKNDWTEEFKKLKDSDNSDTYDRYLYNSNSEESIVTTGVTEFILEANIEIDSHVFSHCMFKGTSSVNQIISMSIYQTDILIYTATFQAVAGVNSFYFEHPIWTVQAGELIDFDLRISTSTGTFTIPVSGLMYWINSVGLVGGEAPIFPEINISDIVSILNNFVNVPSETIVLTSQTPVTINLSETISAITFILTGITENVVLNTETP